MTIHSIRIQNLRSLRDYELQPVPGLNLLWGDNGTGKTSILEAIYLLARGKSFRGGRAGPLITRGEEFLQIFARTELLGRLHAIGIRKTRSDTQVRVDGENVNKLSSLARQTPLQIMTPISHEILERGPEYRRRFVEWGVFHVEHRYQQTLKRFIRILEQRNQALKYNKDVFTAWDGDLVDTGCRLERYRSDYVDELRRTFLEETARLLDGHTLDLIWHSGWKRGCDLKERLLQTRESDLQRGFTTEGPHRADLSIQFDGANASQKASRGQQKMIIASLLIAQSRIAAERLGENPIILIDDFTSELDRNNQVLLFTRLQKLDCQAFITTTEIPSCLDGTGIEMFHVEHSPSG